MNYSIYNTIFGVGLFVSINDRLCAIEFEPNFKDPRDVDNLINKFCKKNNKLSLLFETFIEKDIPKISDVLNCVHYCNVSNFSIRYISGTPFQQMVWDAIRKIPYGKTITYKQLAEQVGSPKSHRAVATACKLNPMPVIILCHRVVPSSGGIGNYTLGVEMKKTLLDREKSSIE